MCFVFFLINIHFIQKSLNFVQQQFDKTISMISQTQEVASANLIQEQITSNKAAPESILQAHKMPYSPHQEVICQLEYKSQNNCLMVLQINSQIQKNGKIVSIPLDNQLSEVQEDEFKQTFVLVRNLSCSHKKRHIRKMCLIIQIVLVLYLGCLSLYNEFYGYQKRYEQLMSQVKPIIDDYYIKKKAGQLVNLQDRDAFLVKANQTIDMAVHKFSRQEYFYRIIFFGAFLLVLALQFLKVFMDLFQIYESYVAQNKRSQNCGQNKNNNKSIQLLRIVWIIALRTYLLPISLLLSKINEQQQQKGKIL